MATLSPRELDRLIDTKNYLMSKRQPRKPQRLSWPTLLIGGRNSIPSEKTGGRKKRQRLAESKLDDAMWVDKFAPTRIGELCVAPKKVKLCTEWLKEATTSIGRSAGNKKLLVLVGSPGIGKSTMVQVLSRELDLEVHCWNESFIPRSQGSAHVDEIVSLQQSSAVDSFAEFLQEAGTGYSALPLTSGHGSKTHVTVGRKRSIILLEDLPNVHGADATVRFRTILTDHLRRSNIPTVLVFSDVAEGKLRPSDLERIIDTDQLYGSETTILQINPVTAPKMKKILEPIAQQHNFRITDEEYEELYFECRGDIRHAIMTLQVQSRRPKHLVGKPAALLCQTNSRDVHLSTFHSLGKLLYAKRVDDGTGTSVLAFDPEIILASSDMGVGGSLRFLEYHSPDFFGSCEDLSNAYALFSDASALLEYRHQSVVSAVVSENASQTCELTALVSAPCGKHYISNGLRFICSGSKSYFSKCCATFSLPYK